MELLTDDEKTTLEMIISERIAETVEIEKVIVAEMEKEAWKNTKQILQDALSLVYEIRSDCRAIARKIGVEVWE